MRGFEVKALGEIAIRCADVGAMLAFYRDIIGLEVLSGDENAPIVFLKIGAGYGGHTAVLALFARDAGRPEIHPQGTSAPVTGAASSLHHIALTVDFAAQDAVTAWYDHNGIAYNIQHFGWIGWRGIFALDPEGNTIELVAYDASLLDSDAA